MKKKEKVIDKIDQGIRDAWHYFTPFGPIVFIIITIILAIFFGLRN